METAVLAGMGAAAGLLWASWGINIVQDVLPDRLLFGVWGGVRLDHRVLAFALACTVVTVCGAGLVPALRGSRATHDSLKSGSHSVANQRHQRRFHGAFVVAQVALSLVLVVSAVLLGRTLERLLRIDRGFETRNLISVLISVPTWKHPGDTNRWDFLERVTTRLRGLAGVTDVTVTGGTPPSGGSIGMDAHLETADGGVLPNGVVSEIPYTDVDPSFFRVMHIPLLAGRPFEAMDMGPGSDAVIISASLAKRLWPDGHAIGKRWRAEAGERWQTVVGVVGDVYWFNYAATRQRYAYYTPRSRALGVGPVQSIVVRVIETPNQMLEPIRRQIASVDPDQPIIRLATVDDEYEEFFAPPRFAALIMSAFAGMALVVAGIALYGVLAHAVTCRAREFGIRLAVGATPSDVARLVLRQGGLVLVIGLTLGIALTTAATRLLGSLLVEVPPLDPFSFGMGVVVLSVVAVLACALPAGRARRAEPSRLLRAE